MNNTIKLLQDAHKIALDINVKGEDTIKIANVILILRQAIENLSQPAEQETEEENG